MKRQYKMNKYRNKVIKIRKIKIIENMSEYKVDMSRVMEYVRCA